MGALTLLCAVALLLAAPESSGAATPAAAPATVSAAAPASFATTARAVGRSGRLTVTNYKLEGDSTTSTFELQVRQHCRGMDGFPARLLSMHPCSAPGPIAAAPPCGLPRCRGWTCGGRMPRSSSRAARASRLWCAARPTRATSVAGAGSAGGRALAGLHLPHTVAHVILLAGRLGALCSAWLHSEAAPPCLLPCPLPTCSIAGAPTSSVVLSVRADGSVSGMAWKGNSTWALGRTGASGAAAAGSGAAASAAATSGSGVSAAPLSSRKATLQQVRSAQTFDCGVLSKPAPSGAKPAAQPSRKMLQVGVAATAAAAGAGAG